MSIIVQLMLLFLIVCAIAVCVTKDLLTSVVIYMAVSYTHLTLPTILLV